MGLIMNTGIGIIVMIFWVNHSCAACQIMLTEWTSSITQKAERIREQGSENG